MVASRDAGKEVANGLAGGGKETSWMLESSSYSISIDFSCCAHSKRLDNWGKGRPRYAHNSSPRLLRGDLLLQLMMDFAESVCVRCAQRVFYDAKTCHEQSLDNLAVCLTAQRDVGQQRIHLSATGAPDAQLESYRDIYRLIVRDFNDALDWVDRATSRLVHASAILQRAEECQRKKETAIINTSVFPERVAFPDRSTVLAPSPRGERAGRRATRESARGPRRKHKASRAVASRVEYDTKAALARVSRNAALAATTESPALAASVSLRRTALKADILAADMLA